MDDNINTFVIVALATISLTSILFIHCSIDKNPTFTKYTGFMADIGVFLTLVLVVIANQSSTGGLIPDEIVAIEVIEEKVVSEQLEVNNILASDFKCQELYEEMYFGKTFNKHKVDDLHLDKICTNIFLRMAKQILWLLKSKKRLKCADPLLRLWRKWFKSDSLLSSWHRCKGTLPHRVCCYLEKYIIKNDY
jgi:hypothetical protein